MSNFFESIKKYGYLRSICYLIFGFAILLQPRSIFKAVVYIIFLYLLIFGVTQLVRGLKVKKYTGNVGVETTGGAVRIVLAFVVLIFSKMIISILPMFLGFIIFIFAISRFWQNWTARRNGFPVTGQLIYTGVMALAGILLLFNPFSSLMVLFQLFGFLLITMAVSEFINTRRLSK
ncbi:HdeD family acid-resistance protein [Enterococcus hailinensis]|uniref:HdeD family acid-resistance protein n=1 Tax=Enterococcus hailinensis TaxID=3238988 RepID=UPI0038B296A9